MAEERVATARPAQDGQLLEGEAADRFRQQWDEVQRHFVDDPRSAVQAADTLVADVLEHVHALFEADRMLLERQWSQGDDSSTEDLRVAVQRYRSFFQRLLSV